MPRKIFLICSVRGVSPELMAAQLAYVDAIERSGGIVHFPPRDTNQAQSGIDICRQNVEAIAHCDEVHVFYKPESQGTHFDMGAAFALGKPVVVAHAPESGPGKNFPRMLREWEFATRKRSKPEVAA